MKRGSDMLHSRSVQAPKRHVRSPEHARALPERHTHVHSASTHATHSQHTPHTHLLNMQEKTLSVLDATKSSEHAAHAHTTHAHPAHVPRAGHMHAPSTHHRSHTVDRLQVPEDAPPRLDSGGDLGGDLACSSPAPVPAAIALFSPDVNAKTASDLLIKLSEATQKAQMKPGTRVEAEPHGETLPAGQEEPGPALSPDGPGASPEPPTLTHTPEGDTTHILASELLRKLAERQDMTCQGVKVKVEEEEEPMDVAVNSDLVPNGSVAEAAALSASNCGLHRLQIEEQNSGASLEDTRHSGAKMEEQGLLSMDTGKRCCSLGETEGQFSNVKSTNTVPGINMADNRLPVRVKRENDSASGAKMECQGLSGAKTEYHNLSGAKMEYHNLSGAKMEYHNLSGAKMEYHNLSGAKMDYQGLSGARIVSNNLQFRVKTENDCFPGAKMEDLCLSGVKMEDQPFVGSELGDHLLSGAKLPDQCLRAVLWQDMSVNLASTLLHQLSEKVSKANNHLIERTSPKTNSPLFKVTATPASENSLPDTARSPHDGQTTFSSNRTISSYFYRCHVCGFETEGRGMFLEHMTVHRQWELSSYSLHCCVCGLSTNQEPEMRVHIDTLHSTGGGAMTGETGCSSPSVATVATVPITTVSSALGAASSSSSSNEHRCRICQRLFPGQQDLLAHFQGHRQGNQYRCDLCGHLTRTANKLVEHVRVHTGERPFTCDLCPYSAKRRDSLRLHCKVKHPTAHAGASSGAVARDAVHTHRSYTPGEAQQQQRCGRNGQLAHRVLGHAPSTTPFALALRPLLSERPGWRDLSPLLPITTLLSLKHPVSPSSSGAPPAPVDPSSSGVPPAPVSPPSSGAPPAPVSPSSSGSPPPPVSPPSPGSTSVKHSFLAYLGLMGSS